MKMKSLGGSILAAVLAVSTAVSGLSVTAATAQSVVEESAVLVSASATVSITTASGDLESAYAQWSALSGAEGYNVYVKKSGGSYTQIDTMLVREYPSYFRADVPGLAAGSYTLKVVPVISGKEDTSKASETASLTVEAHDRTGFAFVSDSKYTSTTASGAYNDDGTLKSNAVVLYITEDTKNTVTLDVTTSSKGATTTAVGVQNILTAYQKGYDSRPLDLRFIGNITDPDTLMDGDLLVKGNGASKRLSCGVTVEGIGNDTVFNGFGLRIANASNVEVRNLGFMNCNSDEGDDVGLQQNNDHIWVHNCDFFYGDAGSDADQVKGDGALDTKTSTYITHSYNHFWDNGKCNLQGMKSESTENYITYHHNWYDHSDSRHPRIRTCSVHSYNNYFDGNAKYGVGVTLGASAYVEANYFRNCKNPMLISGQGTDALGAGTFSGEAGGIIKAYANVIVGASSYITYAEDNTEFDAYEVSSASETIPSTVKSVSGGNTYNNFDTDSSIMYSYTADAAEDVPSIVTAKAGRVQGGDFQWEFDNSVDDTSYAVNDALKAALTAYTTSIISIGSGYTTDGSSADTPVTTTASTATTKATTTTTTASTTGATSATTKATVVTTTVDVVTDGDIFCSPTGTGTGETASDPASVTDAISRLTPGHTIYLLAGTYSFSETILIDQNNCGTADAMKTIKNYNGAKVVFDFSGQETADANRGIVLDGNYWYFYGFEITKAGDNGMLLSGSNNKLERMVFNDNQDTGLQISRYRSSAETIDTWPSNNLILNCTSKNNCDDLTMENADGFAAKLTCGEGNVFDGCMAYNNSDDGWDLFAKSATGPIGVVTIQNCIAFRNGYTEFGEGYGECDGNGFKLGGSGVGSAHVVINCLAFENLNCGFTDNNNPKLDTLINCTSYNNGVGANGKPNVSCYRCTDDGCDFSNLISYYSKENLTSNLGATGLTKISNDKFVGTIQNAVYYNSGYYLVTDKTDVTNNEKVGTKGCTISDSDFASVVAPEMGTDFDIVWRNADGSITTQGFMQVVESSDFYSIRGAVFDTVEAPVVTTTAPEETSATTTTTASSVYTSTAPNSSTAAIDSETETTTVATTSPASTDSEEIEATTTTTTTTTTTVAVSSVTTAESQDTSASSSSVESGETTTTTKETQGTTSEGSEGMLLYGDVNLDGRVDVTDAVLLNKAAAGAVQLNSIQFQNADCFSDSTLSGEDAQSLMRFLVHLVDSLPIFE